MKLSTYFSLDELTRSQTATAHGIANQPGPAEVDQLRQLATQVLDPLRKAAGLPLRVTSGYRSPALNKRIGGSSTSQHSKGQAADLQADGMPALELFKTAIRSGIPFDQLIYEAQSASVKWVHVSHAPGANRREIRIAKFDAAGRPSSYPLVTAEQALAMTEPHVRSTGRAVPEGYVETADEPKRAVSARKKPAGASSVKKGSDPAA